jgi:acetylxylan esterase
VDYNYTPHQPEGCNDIRIFNVRGSDEPYPGRGGALLGLVCAEFAAHDVDCDYEDVVYPANISYSGIFCESAHTGALAGQAQMTGYASACPEGKTVLIGYSQGAGVVGDILGGGGGEVFDCQQEFNEGLSREEAPGSLGELPSFPALLPFKH